MKHGLTSTHERVAEGLYRAWCEGVKMTQDCFDPLGWEEFKDAIPKRGCPSADTFLTRARLLLPLGSPDDIMAQLIDAYKSIYPTSGTSLPEFKLARICAAARLRASGGDG